MTCIICGGQHRGWERCKVANSDMLATPLATEAETVVNKAPEVANKALAQVANGLLGVANKHGQYADKEKRREYMKLYMAKRRALPPH